MKADPPSIFLLAGEPSGDRIGGELLCGLLEDGEYNITGVGGEQMLGHGLRSLYPMNDLSVMGFTDVIKRLPLLLWRIAQTVRHIMRTKPDVVILIDSQVFSTMIAKKIKKRGFSNPVLLYVAPAVWAWKPERAVKLAPIFDEVLAVLPFEPEVMKKLHGPKTSFVGHPAARTIQPIAAKNNNNGLVALLPGSRMGEIRRHMPMLKQMVARLKDHPQITGFILPTLPHMEEELCEGTASWSAPVEVVSKNSARNDAMENVIFAIATAGTITLEFALSHIPMVVTYVPDKQLMRHYIKAGKPMIALPNIIMGKKVVPEIIASEDNIEEILDAVMVLLEDKTKRDEQIASFAEIQSLLLHGVKGSKRQNPVDRVLAHLQ